MPLHWVGALVFYVGVAVGVMYVSCLLIVSVFAIIEKRRPSFQGYFIHEGEVPGDNHTDS